MIPSRPEIPKCDDKAVLPEGTKISQKNGKTIIVGKGNGVYLDNSCFSNIEYALKLWRYYADGVEKNVESFNKSLDGIEKKNQPKEEKKGWFN